MTTPEDPDRLGSPDPSQARSSFGSPSPSERDVETVGPPREVVISFWIWIATSVLLVVSVLPILGQLDEIRAQALAEDSGEFSPEQIEQAVNQAVGLFFFVYLSVALLFTLFAFKAKAGRNWARIALAVVTGLNLIAFLGGPNQSGLGSLSLLVSSAAVVLLFLPNSNAYFAANRRTTRS